MRQSFVVVAAGVLIVLILAIFPRENSEDVIDIEGSVSSSELINATDSLGYAISTQDRVEYFVETKNEEIETISYDYEEFVEMIDKLDQDPFTQVNDIVDFTIPEESLGKAAGSFTGTQNVAVLMCKFSDVSTEPHSASHFDSLFNNAALPSQKHYWESISNNQISINADVYGWFTIPVQESTASSLYSDYLYPCVEAADSTVDFSTYDNIMLAFNDSGTRLSYTAYGGGATLNLDGGSRTYGVIWADPTMYSKPFVLAHEMGHSFGLPHSGLSSSNPYGSGWDVMSYGYRTGYIPVGVIAPFLYYFGWFDPSEVLTINYDQFGSDQTVNLDFLSNFAGSGYKMIQIKHSNPSIDNNILTLEARDGTDQYDQGIPGSGIIMHDVLNSSFYTSVYLKSASSVPVGGDTIANAIYSGQTQYYDQDRDLLYILESTYSGGYTLKIASAVNKVTFSNVNNYDIFASVTDEVITINTQTYNKTVSKVDFYVNDSLYATDSTAPYEFTWTDASATEIFKLEAIATMNDSSIVSDEIAVFKGGAYPVVDIPVNGTENLSYNTSTKVLSGTMTVTLPNKCYEISSTAVNITSKINLSFAFSNKVRVGDLCTQSVFDISHNVNKTVELDYNSLVNPTVQISTNIL